MGEIKKIVLNDTFVKSLEKLKKSEIKLDVEKLAASNYYLKGWRKFSEISFNKRDTLKLAVAYQKLHPNLTLYQAKLLLSQYKWWDYGYFIDLISSFDKEAAERFHQELDIIDSGGETRYEKKQDPEYQKQLDAHWDEMMSSSETKEDGSTLIKVIDNDEKYPLLKITEKEIKQSQLEIDEEMQQFSQEMASWFQEHLQYKDFFVLYLDIWAHRYSRKCFNANGNVVRKQILLAKNSLLKEEWAALAKSFNSFMNWWD